MTLTIPTSGQSRIDAKRRQRADFWESRRTVQVLIGGELLPHIDRLVQLLGNGAQIHRATPRVHGWVVDLDVHIPGAPQDAHRARPRFGIPWDAHTPVLRLLGIDWFDANGRILPATAQP